MRAINTSRLIYLFDLLIILTIKDLKIKYKSSFLGYFWSLLHPLSFALIFYFIFKVVIKFPIDNYVAFLLSGLFPWQWISNSLVASTTVLLVNASLIKKVKCPSYVFPLSIIIQDGIHFLLSIPVIFLILSFYSIPLSFFQLIFIMPLLIVQTLLLYGLSLIFSSINLFFRDLERLVSLSLTLIFYFTPIIYTVDLIPEHLRKYFIFNPFYPLIECWHQVFLRATLPYDHFIVSLIYGLSVFVIGFTVFKRLSYRFAEAL